MNLTFKKLIGHLHEKNINMKMSALLLMVFLPLILQAQHTISGSFSPKENFTFTILYKNTATEKLYSKDMALDSLGNVNYKMTEKDAAGIYSLVYAIPQEENSFDIIYNGKEDVDFNLDMKKGISFTASKENIIYNDYNVEMVAINKKIYEAMVSNKGSKTFKKLFKEQSKVQQKFEKQSAGLICNIFIKAAAPYLPKSFISVETYNQEIQNHYFDSIDVTNETLQKSKFLFDKFILFIRNEKDVDAVVSQLSKTSEDFQLSMLDRLFKEFSKYENNLNSKYIGNQYLIPLLEKNGKTKEAEVVKTAMNTAIGAKAPNFSWEKVQDGKLISTSLYDQKDSENYLVVFWSSTCSHCLTEMPKLSKQLQYIEKSKLEAIAFGLEDGEESWNKEIKILPNFTHILGLEHWNNKVGKAYDIHVTPTFILLNSDKKIIAKPQTLEELLGLISNKK